MEPRTDLLWASPECTNHSRAKGRKLPTQPDLFGDVLPDAAADRSRATMWDVVRFTEQPDASAPPTFRAGWLIGKFQGEKAATGPIG